MMRQTIPRLDTPDYILSFGSLDISVRQFLLLVLGFLLSANVWLSLAWLDSVLFWLLLVLPVIVVLVFGWGTIQGQPLEYRIFALLRYLKRPKIYVWCSLREGE
jgi:hypothetical protein